VTVDHTFCMEDSAFSLSLSLSLSLSHTQAHTHAHTHAHGNVTRRRVQTYPGGHKGLVTVDHAFSMGDTTLTAAVAVLAPNP